MRSVFTIAAVVFALDQIIKVIVVQWMNLKYLGEIDVFPPYLNLRMAWNTGINFGLFSGQSDTVRYTLIAIALVIVAVVIVWVWREPLNKVARISAGLLIGGALGNVVDRFVYGAVADFLNMSCCGIENPFAFNVADISIFVGAVGLVLFGDTKAPRKKGA